MKLNQEELHEALGHVLHEIEKSVASTGMTRASLLVSDLRRAVIGDNLAALRVIQEIGGPRELPVPADLAPFQPHERRVIVEYRELQEKITKLHAFLVDNEKLARLDPSDVDKLVEQHRAMLKYNDVLVDRIDVDKLVEQHRAMLKYNDVLVDRIDKFAPATVIIDRDTRPTPEQPSALFWLTTLAKGFRKDLDGVLQKMKAHRDEITTPGLYIEGVEDQREVVANHVLSLRHVEDAIMRQGMALKCIGATPNPYPQSYNPASPAIEPTADGLKL